jgi:alanine racemase
MTRGGFLSEWNQLDAHHVADVDIVGIYSHFARADEPAERQNQEQLARFTEMSKTLSSLWIYQCLQDIYLATAATLTNSAAAFLTWYVLGYRHVWLILQMSRLLDLHNR